VGKKNLTQRRKERKEGQAEKASLFLDFLCVLCAFA
jgi:hypothetical protein